MPAKKTGSRQPGASRGSRKTASSVPASVEGRRRVVVERVRPEVDAGRFPIKRTVGEWVDVTAHVHADGHDVVVAVLRHRVKGPGADDGWNEVPMDALGNDEFSARFRVDRVGAYEFTVVGWIDHFKSWRKELAAKVQAGLQVDSELLEGAVFVREAAARAAAVASEAEPGPAADAQSLERDAETLGTPGSQAPRAHAALSDHLHHLMGVWPDRSLATEYGRVLGVRVDRERARFGSWYEMFPRSWGPDSTRSATFAEAATHLPRVAELGFDVVYLPPVHPIGTSFRKGRGNSLVAEPGDPGSPWAIGSPDGGHMAIEPGLGTVDDFRGFVESAQALGMEIALDLAFQCSPDHPYVKSHPEWFRHRPDGTIKYAENPPKKYQDIYPLNFETPAWRELWEELREVVRFWVRLGVRIFRVDNPHTKPYAFWEWLIAEIQQESPDVIFLAEAFTRPKVMYYLAKLGFTQSYTYFTWRNAKPEIEEYFTELTRTEVHDFFRPNLFANTPDILHAYLQEGGPPAFRARLVLAATLGATYGIYSGFELCEGRAVPGTEEYLDSEKYQIRRWDWDHPEHIRDLVATVNRIRRDNQALQYDGGLAFHDTDNPELICYSKTSPDGRQIVVVVVNLDPQNLQHGHVRLPLADWHGEAAAETATATATATVRRYVMHDLLTDVRFEWGADWNYVRLDPADMPAHVLRVERE